MADDPLLKKYWPELVAKLKRGLENEGEEQLAATVCALRVNALCRCGGYDCQSFYTTSARGPWPDLGTTHESIPLDVPDADAPDAMIVLDVINGDTIVFVEILLAFPGRREPGYDELANRVGYAK